ncbi:MAG TPA: hypothetical protein PLF40_19835 [Kofleriaceae bacterium]|nr:hypothetical protein [Kofleriaceae bacterium]
MKKISVLFLITTVFAGCSDSGSSGVDRNTKLSAATATEKTQFCDWQTEVSGGAGQKQCGNNTSVTVKTAAECVEKWPTASSCTIGVIEDCYASIEGDACKLLTSTQCAAAIQCLLQ